MTAIAPAPVFLAPTERALRKAKLRAGALAHNDAFEELAKAIREHGACQCEADAFTRPTGERLAELNKGTKT